MNLDLLNYLKNKVKNKMSIKYQSINNQYNKEISNQLIYNMRTLIVANYKEFLLFQARTENLKRYKTRKVQNKLKWVKRKTKNVVHIFLNGAGTGSGVAGARCPCRCCTP